MNNHMADVMTLGDMCCNWPMYDAAGRYMCLTQVFLTKMLFGSCHRYLQIVMDFVEVTPVLPPQPAHADSDSLPELSCCAGNP